jgi:hypothetical protein
VRHHLLHPGPLDALFLERHLKVRQ